MRKLKSPWPMKSSVRPCAVGCRAPRKNSWPLRPSAQNREKDLAVQNAPADHPISPTHLERLVRELVENGCKFSQPGQRVRVKSGPTPHGFQLQVTDQGCGFTPEQIRLTSANIQFGRKMNEQQGTGLGLSICRRIAELYGGELAVESVAGQSTRVTVQFPG